MNQLRDPLRVAICFSGYGRRNVWMPVNCRKTGNCRQQRSGRMCLGGSIRVFAPASHLPASAITGGFGHPDQKTGQCQRAAGLLHNIGFWFRCIGSNKPIPLIFIGVVSFCHSAVRFGIRRARLSSGRCQIWRPAGRRRSIRLEGCSLQRCRIQKVSFLPVRRRNIFRFLTPGLRQT